MRMKKYSILMKNVVFNCNGMGVFNIGLNNSNNNNNLGNSFDEDDSDNIILIRRLAWHINT